uniref:RRM domain-containing protein n=1 Tax=Leersia perrieri TaxID=77586 RepID=A0A0D9VVS9_9ORYZ
MIVDPCLGQLSTVKPAKPLPCLSLRSSHPRGRAAAAAPPFLLLSPRLAPTPMMQPPPQQWAMGPPPPRYFQGGPPPPPHYFQGPPPPAAMWGQPPPPPQAAAPAPAAGGGGAGGDEGVKTLWIGDLQYWMDESYLYNCFSQAGEVTTAKIIRNKQTGQPEGYGFIEFGSHAIAEQVLQGYNGQMMPNGTQVFKLNWATSGGAADKRGDDGSGHTIFVGDLASDVTDVILQDTFKSHYPSVKGAKVVIDRSTGRSKGYGFVEFGDSDEQTRAMTEMNGQYCSSRPMRIGAASNKKNIGGQQQPSAMYQNTQGTDSDSDPNNTTVFVGGLDPSVTDEVLKQTFSPYGELVYVKIPVGKRCGFVQYSNRASAEEAIRVLNGSQLGGQSVRLSWGRSPGNKQPQQDQNQWNGGYYGYPPQGYNPYGYSRPSQDPAMYAYAAYPGYGNYQQAPPQQPPQQS